jgi:iron complex transport system substrate-binding protein
MSRRFLAALLISIVGLLRADGALAATRSFVDAAGRKVEVPLAVNRAMAAGPPASVLLYALAPDKVAGWLRPLSAEQKAFIAERYRDLPVTGRLTGKEGDADAATVRKVKPDLIIDVGTVDAEYAALADRIQKQTGVPYILVDGSLAKTPETLRSIGELLGVADRGKALADYAQAVIDRAGAAARAVPANQRLRVYYGRGPDGLQTGGAGSINLEFLSAIGATNVAEGAGTGRGLVKVTPQQITSWNPDVILTLDAGFEQAALTDPSWSQIPAMRDKRLYRAPALPFGWIDEPPGVNRLIGIDWLISILYSGRSTVDLGNATREFYSLFYHVNLTDQQLASLLAFQP